ncbi:MAG TPA: diguanylate cyclase [bacterium]|nr:diguanylate cyclase [bacterium]
MGDHLRILAADDEPSVLSLYGEILSPSQASDGDDVMAALEAKIFGVGQADVPVGPVFDLVLCSQGDEALEKIRSSIDDEDPFSAAFLDVRMPPGPDGVSVAESIRVLDPFINIVIVTGYSDVDPLEIARRVPPADKLLYVQKPFHVHEIRQFASALTAKWLLERRLAIIMSELEQKIEERTKELIKVNQELVDTNKVLEKLSLTDDLTKLYNKRYFNKKIAEWVTYSKRYKAPLSLIMFDIDHFKQYNDLKGHLMGDLLLEKLGQLVQHSLRRQIDTAFGGIESSYRFGGEEFAIILPRTDRSGAHIVAERLRSNVEKETGVTISVGVTDFDEEKDDAASLVHKADLNLYEAKKRGRNCVVS